MTKIKESNNEDVSFVEDDEKKSGKGSKRSNSSDDSINRRQSMEAGSPMKSKNHLDLKSHASSGDSADIFKKSPRTRQNSDQRKIEIEGVDSEGRLSHS